MVQQLSLFGAIDDDSYELFISTITTSFGASPIVFANLSTIWKPDPRYDIGSVNAKNQLMEQTRIKVCKSVPLMELRSKSNDSNNDGDNNINKNHDPFIDYKILPRLKNESIPIDASFINNMMGNAANSVESARVSNWAMSISDIPAAGNTRKVCMQAITESIILDAAGPNASLVNFMKELYYVSEYQYVTVGVKFYMKHNLILEVQKIWDATSNRQVTNGGFIIKAYININKSTDIERINHSERILLNIQKDLQGYVDLTVPDRKAMDSRMGYTE